MRHLLFAGVMFLIGLLPLHSFAQLPLVVKDQFTNSHPNVQFFEKDGTTNMIYGTAFSTGDTPLLSVSNHLKDWSDLYGKNYGELVPEVKPDGKVAQGLMPDKKTGVNKFHVLRFNQQINGVPVFRSGVGFLVRNSTGNPLVMSGFDVKDMRRFRMPRGGVPEPGVSDQMLENVWNMMEAQTAEPAEATTQEPQLDESFSVLEKPKRTKDPNTTEPNIFVRAERNARRAIADIVAVVTAPGVEASEEKLVVWPGGDGAKPELAVSFIAKRGSVQTYPDYHRYLIVASVETGEILLSENQIQSWDVAVSGWVVGRATRGIGADVCHMERQVFLPYAEVGLFGGKSVFTTKRGGYTIRSRLLSPVPAPVLVQSFLRGKYFEVRDQAAGNTIPSLLAITWPPGFLRFAHNPFATGDEFQTANVNAYYEANRFRDYVLEYEPTFPVINSEQFFDINTNIGFNCNAFYDGTSINFFVAGSGCANSAFSDVIYHEYGHHLVQVTGNGQGQFGEGAGDVMSVLFQDEPVIGHGFDLDCTQGIRSAANNLQYPCGPPNGIHHCGQLLSGCVWDVRNELAVTKPDDYRDIGASLFFGMMILRGVADPDNPDIDPSIRIMYLLLDDDDADLGNGTPHSAEIIAGFGAHNM